MQHLYTLVTAVLLLPLVLVTVPNGGVADAFIISPIGKSSAVKSVPFGDLHHGLYSGRPSLFGKSSGSTESALRSVRRQNDQNAEDGGMNEKHKDADMWQAFLKSNKALSTMVLQVAMILTLSFSTPLTTLSPAHAVLGAGGAVVSSPTVVKAITLEEFLKLPLKKQRQYEGGFLSCKYEMTGADNNKAVRARDRKPPRKICKPTNIIDELLKEIDVMSEIDPDRADEFQAVAQNLLTRQRLMDRQSLEADLTKQPEFIYFGCALLASCVSTSIMHPLDTLKVRLMSRDNNEDEDGGSENEVETSLFDTVKDLYNGLLPNLLKEGPASALYLGVYEFSRTKLYGVPFLQDNPLLIYLLAGSIGEFVGSILRSPSEAVKVRVQTGMFDVPGAFQNVFFTEEGRRNTLMAWFAGVFRDVPHGAILIATFEVTKTLIVDSAVDIDVNTLLSEALLGGLGGGLGAFISTPSDVITTKIITSMEVKNDDGGEETEDTPPPLSPQVALAEVWNEGGLEGIFSGYMERIIYWTLSYGIFLSVYCSLRQHALQLFG